MEQENQYSESAVEELTPDYNCHSEGECHCHNCRERQSEIFDESDIDRIIANLNTRVRDKKHSEKVADSFGNITDI